MAVRRSSSALLIRRLLKKLKESSKKKSSLEWTSNRRGYLIILEASTISVSISLKQTWKSSSTALRSIQERIMAYNLRRSLKRILFSHKKYSKFR
jgi:hypothetical protein